MSELPLDLSACDTEPIHVPGAIQAHGVLFALREEDLVILQVSANCEAMLGVKARPVPGRPLGEVLGAEVAEAVARSLRALDLVTENPLRLEVGGRPFDGVLHRSGAAVILELEPLPGKAVPIDRLLRDAVTRLQRASSVAELCAIATEQIRLLTGFDRAMAYRFHADGHGEVVSEAKAAEVEPLLGFHFPASDIPRQARQLYVLNSIRVIPDARGQPVPLLGAAGVANAPLDMTFASLRAVSPVHLEYLGNMGVRASMSVSLICGDRLWGLLACHHFEARYVPFLVRAACDVVGKLVSVEIDALDEREKRAESESLRGGRSLLVEAMKSAPGGWATGLLGRPELLLSAVRASGAALFDENGIRTVGEAPAIADVAAIAAWLSSGQGSLFATSALERELSQAAAWRGVASGLLAARVRRPEPAYILWFRHEVVRKVAWGGDPNKPVVEPDGDGRLHPRHSFAAWKEIVRGTSVPWSQAEVEIAEDLARRAVEVDLEKQIARAEEAIRTRDDLVAVVSRDLKNPVNVIQVASQLARRQPLNAISEATLDRIDRAATQMAVLITDLLDLAKIEAGRFQVRPAVCESKALIAEGLAQHAGAAEQRSIRFEVEGEDVPVLADRDRIFQVLGNLLNNAIRYTPVGGAVYVVTRAADGFARISVRDAGPGIAANALAHVFERYWQAPAVRSRQGSGLGLYIAKGLVEAHGGRIWVETVPGKGTTFYFTIPRAAG